MLKQLAFPTLLLSLTITCFSGASAGAHGQQPLAPPKAATALPTQEDLTAARAGTRSESTDDFTAECMKNAAKAGKLSFGCYGRSRLNSSAEANRYFGGLEVGDVVAVTVGDDRATLYTELVSDNVFTWAGLGYARMGFGALVAANDDNDDDDAGAGEDEETTIQQFFAGGGNGSAYVAVPFYRWVNAVADGAVPARPLRRADLGFTAAVRGDVPALNEAVESPAASFYLGARVDATQHSSTDRFRFFVVADGGWVRGTDAFYDNLDVETVPAWGSLTAKLTGGVDLNQLIRVGVSSGWSTLGSVSLPWRLSVQLLPQ
jgi:hypothetical protein